MREIIPSDSASAYLTSLVTFCCEENIFCGCGIDSACVSAEPDVPAGGHEGWRRWGVGWGGCHPAVYFNNFHFIHQLSGPTSGLCSCSSFITSAGQVHTLTHMHRLRFELRGAKKREKKRFECSRQSKNKKKTVKGNNQTPWFLK